MKDIGKVKFKWNGETVMVPVTEDGYVQLPDGTMRKIRDDRFQEIKEKLLNAPIPPTNNPAPSDESDAQTHVAPEPASDGREISSQKDSGVSDENRSPAMPDANAPVQSPDTPEPKKDRKQERKAHKAAEKQKELEKKQRLKEERENARKEKTEGKKPMTPGKAAAIGVASVLLLEGFFCAGYYVAKEKGLVLSGPEVTATISEAGSIPDGAESVLIIARVRGEDGVERDIALGEFYPNT